MTKKRVWRYYCDFCKKRGCSGGHIKRHEQACTMNPDRKCGMCKMVCETQQPMAELKSKFIPLVKLTREDEFGSIHVIESCKLEFIAKLDQARPQCPACTLAALRQIKIPIPITPFNYGEECKSVWADINAAQHDHDP